MTQFTCKGVKQINNRISFKHLYHSYLSAFFISARVPMGNFQKYWSQNVGQDFIVLDFVVGGRKGCVREINVSRAWDPVHAGDKALTRETSTKRGRVNRYGIIYIIIPCMICQLFIVCKFKLYMKINDMLKWKKRNAQIIVFILPELMHGTG
jgi:hypothetical protein